MIILHKKNNFLSLPGLLYCLLSLFGPIHGEENGKKPRYGDSSWIDLWYNDDSSSAKYTPPHSMLADDEISRVPINFGQSININGHTIHDLYISTNGYISINEAINLPNPILNLSTQQNLVADIQKRQNQSFVYVNSSSAALENLNIIAPFWTDLIPISASVRNIKQKQTDPQSDTENGNEKNSGTFWQCYVDSQTIIPFISKKNTLNKNYQQTLMDINRQNWSESRQTPKNIPENMLKESKNTTYSTMETQSLLNSRVSTLPNTLFTLKQKGDKTIQQSLTNEMQQDSNQNFSPTNSDEMLSSSLPQMNSTPFVAQESNPTPKPTSLVKKRTTTVKRSNNNIKISNPGDNESENREGIVDEESTTERFVKSSKIGKNGKSSNPNKNLVTPVQKRSLHDSLPSSADGYTEEICENTDDDIVNDSENAPTRQQRKKRQSSENESLPPSQIVEKNAPSNIIKTKKRASEGKNIENENTGTTLYTRMNRQTVEGVCQPGIPDYINAKISQMLGGASVKDLIKPRFVLVVTWKNVTPYPTRNTFASPVKLTFQTVLVFGGKGSFHIFFHYLPETWNNGGAEGMIGLQNPSIANLLIGFTLFGHLKGYPWTLFWTNITHISDAYWIAKVPGNTGQIGLYHYTIPVLSDFGDTCRNLFVEYKRPFNVSNSQRIFEECPCTLEQAKRDYRYVIIEGNCARLKFQLTHYVKSNQSSYYQTTQSFKYQPVCCYDIALHNTLIPTFPSRFIYFGVVETPPGKKSFESSSEENTENFLHKETNQPQSKALNEQDLDTFKLWQACCDNHITSETETVGKNMTLSNSPAMDLCSFYHEVQGLLTCIKYEHLQYASQNVHSYLIPLHAPTGYYYNNYNKNDNENENNFENINEESLVYRLIETPKCIIQGKMIYKKLSFLNTTYVYPNFMHLAFKIGSLNFIEVVYDNSSAMHMNIYWNALPISQLPKYSEIYSVEKFETNRTYVITTYHYIARVYAHDLQGLKLDIEVAGQCNAEHASMQKPSLLLISYEEQNHKFHWQNSSITFNAGAENGESVEQIAAFGKLCQINLNESIIKVNLDESEIKLLVPQSEVNLRQSINGSDLMSTMHSLQLETIIAHESTIVQLPIVDATILNQCRQNNSILYWVCLMEILIKYTSLPEASRTLPDVNYKTHLNISQELNHRLITLIRTEKMAHTKFLQLPILKFLAPNLLTLVPFQNNWFNYKLNHNSGRQNKLETTFSNGQLYIYPNGTFNFYPDNFGPVRIAIFVMENRIPIFVYRPSVALKQCSPGHEINFSGNNSENRKRQNIFSSEIMVPEFMRSAPTGLYVQLPCHCKPNRFGPHCDQHYCSLNPCFKGAACVLAPNQKDGIDVLRNLEDITCPACPSYAKGNGLKCEDIDECLTPDTNKCNAETSHCINLFPFYQCKCHEGFEPSGPDMTCKAIDVCGRPEKKCPQTFTCFNEYPNPQTVTSKCVCPPGTRLCDNVCMGINECLDGDVCGENMECINLDQGFKCICRPGYRLGAPGSFGNTNINNNPHCIDFDECDRLESPHRNNCTQICINRPGSFQCACFDGFEPESLTNPNAPRETCRPKQGCLMSECINSSYCTIQSGREMCSCPPGYLLQSDGQCIDIDECMDTHNLCHHANAALCINTPGGYRCECSPGYVWDSYNVTCQDIDECSNPLLHNCTQLSYCVNTPGAYKCECPLTYERDPNDLTKCRNKLLCGGQECPPHSTCRVSWTPKTAQNTALDMDDSNSYVAQEVCQCDATYFTILMQILSQTTQNVRQNSVGLQQQCNRSPINIMLNLTISSIPMTHQLDIFDILQSHTFAHFWLVREIQRPIDNALRDKFKEKYIGSRVIDIRIFDKIPILNTPLNRDMRNVNDRRESNYKYSSYGNDNKRSPKATMLTPRNYRSHASLALKQNKFLFGSAQNNSNTNNYIYKPELYDIEIALVLMFLHKGADEGLLTGPGAQVNLIPQIISQTFGWPSAVSSHVITSQRRNMMPMLQKRNLRLDTLPNVNVEQTEYESIIESPNSYDNLLQHEAKRRKRQQKQSTESSTELQYYANNTTSTTTVLDGSFFANKNLSHTFESSIDTHNLLLPRINNDYTTFRTSKGENIPTNARYLPTTAIKVYPSTLVAQDLNECETELNNCPPEYTVCVNEFGSFRCDCRPGFAKAPHWNRPDVEICRDIDECKTGAHNCSLFDADCVNLPGSFTCKCPPGSSTTKPGETRCIKNVRNVYWRNFAIFASVLLGIIFLLGLLALLLLCCKHSEQVKKRIFYTNTSGRTPSQRLIISPVMHTELENSPNVNVSSAFSRIPRPRIDHTSFSEARQNNRTRENFQNRNLNTTIRDENVTYKQPKSSFTNNRAKNYSNGTSNGDNNRYVYDNPVAYENNFDEIDLADQSPSFYPNNAANTMATNRSQQTKKNGKNNMYMTHF